MFSAQPATAASLAARMMPWLKRFEHRPKQWVALLCIVIVTMVGLVDFATGYETFFFSFYLLAVFLGVWFVSIPFGILISALSVAAWASSNIIAGARYSSYVVPVWNSLVMFCFYLVVVWLLAKLKGFNRELENRVELRTESLAREIRERLRLQKELLDVGERERRRIGHELHDGLCQQLTGTALAAKLLPESKASGKLLQLIEEAIELTRKLSRSLSPIELKPGHLREDFRELAAASAIQFKVACRFECDSATPLPDANVATHLFHIAQEAVANAAHHGHAQTINICLDASEDELALTITDDGAGRLENFQKKNGLGLRLMRHRADLIGATFEIENLTTSGVRVTCTLPLLAVSQENFHGE